MNDVVSPHDRSFWCIYIVYVISSIYEYNKQNHTPIRISFPYSLILMHIVSVTTKFVVFFENSVYINIIWLSWYESYIIKEHILYGFKTSNKTVSIKITTYINQVDNHR